MAVSAARPPIAEVPAHATYGKGVKGENGKIPADLRLKMNAFWMILAVEAPLSPESKVQLVH